MKVKNLYIIILLAFFFLIGCKNDSLNFDSDQTYIGFWNETQWTYTFKENGEFILESKGHLGGEGLSGFYFKKDTLITLLTNTEYFENCRYTRFRIYDNNSIRDFKGNFYCKTGEELEKRMEKRFEETELLRQEIENLELVINTRAEIISQNSTKKYVMISRGMIVIKGEEFYEHQLESWLPEFKRNRVHLRLYSKYNPIRIYNDDFLLIKEVEVKRDKD